MPLLTSYKLGNIELKNRMVMAPMTRSRSFSKGVATDLMAEYYAQRASAGLILSEAINISADAIGSPFTPGLYTAEQVESWKKVTDAVHKKGGVIFAQLWHTGRVAHSVDRNGVLPVAPSAVKIEGMQHFTSQGVKDYETPREMSIADIRQTIADYAQAAKNAIAAGFDGVELHAANGYLPQQFLSDSANLRTDEYGGSIENKAWTMCWLIAFKAWGLWSVCWAIFSYCDRAAAFAVSCSAAVCRLCRAVVAWMMIRGGSCPSASAAARRRCPSKISQRLDRAVSSYTKTGGSWFCRARLRQYFRRPSSAWWVFRAMKRSAWV